MYNRTPYIKSEPINLLNLRKEGIPNFNDPAIQQSLEVNKLSSEYKPTGTYSKAIQKERQDINSIYSKHKPISDWVGYVPNSQFPFVNKLLRLILTEKQDYSGHISLYDLEYLKKLWMKQEAKEAMIAFFTPFVDETLAGLSAPPQTRSQLKPSAVDGQLKLNLSNPGMVSLDNMKNQLEKLKNVNQDNKDLVYKLDELTADLQYYQDMIEDVKTNIKQKLPQRISKEMKEGYFREVDNSIYEYIDKNVLELVNKLETELTNDRQDIPSIYRIADQLVNFHHERENLYYASILNPKSKIAHRIPSLVPIPTATFSVHYNLTMQVNASGNAAMVIEPFYLGTTPNTGVNYNNDPTLTGLLYNNNFIGINAGQTLPAALYNNYRLVSACLEFTPIVSQLNSSGYYTMGWNQDTTVNTSTVGFVNPNVQQYGMFSLIENANTRITKPLSDNTKTAVLYLPPDESFFDFQVVGTDKKGFNYVLYVSGAPANVVAGRVDLTFNYEATVLPALVDYIPTSYYTGNSTDLHYAMTHLSSPIIEGDVSNMFPSVPDKKGYENWFLPSVPKQEIRDLVNKRPNMIEGSQKEKKGFLDSLISTIKDVVEPIGEVLPELITIGKGVASLM